MKAGDHVNITCDGHTVEGVILLSSGNAVSLMIEFEAILDGHVGLMPLLMDERGDYRSIVTDKVVLIKPCEEVAE
jgi:hypothetical protein